MRGLSSTLVVLLLAGCLGDLTKPAGEDGGPGGGGDWPGDLDIRITTLVADLNGNASPDLVLLNDPATEEDRGLLVFFDRASGFFEAPDQFLSTDGLHPLVAATDDFSGGAALDLMVVARAEDDSPYLIVFEGSGASSFAMVKTQGFPGSDLTAGSVSVPEPVFAARTYVLGSHDAPAGLVFGDLDDVFYVSIPSDRNWMMVTATDDVAIPSGSTTMNLALPILSAVDDRNDILLLDNQGAYRWQNDGADPAGFQAGSTFDGLWPDRRRAFFAFDIEADGIPDFMTLELDDLRVAHVSSSGAALDIDVRSVSASPVFGDGQGDALFAADVDGGGSIDLLLLDDVKPGSPNDERFILMAARNLTDNADGTTIDPESGRIDADDSWVGDPTRLVAGDFDVDGDVDVWVFDQTLGFKQCLEGEVFSGDMYRFKACD
jgi:hypothetical protein